MTTIQSNSETTITSVPSMMSDDFYNKTVDIMSLSNAKLIALYLRGIEEMDSWAPGIAMDLEHYNGSLNDYFTEHFLFLYPNFGTFCANTELDRLARVHLARRRALEIGNTPNGRLTSGTIIYSIDDIHQYLFMRFMSRQAEFGFIGLNGNGVITAHESIDIIYNDNVMDIFISRARSFCRDNKISHIIVYVNRGNSTAGLFDNTDAERVFKHRLIDSLEMGNVTLNDLIFQGGGKFVSYLDTFRE